MNSYLLYRDSTIEGKHGYYSKRDMIKDLNLEILFRTMAGEDVFVAENVRQVMMIPLQTPDEIRYRQDILQDLCNDMDFMDTLYEFAERQHKAVRLYRDEIEKNRTRSTGRTGETIGRINFLRKALADLIQLRDLLTEKQKNYHSEGLQSLCQRLCRQPLEQYREKADDLDFFVMGGKTSYLFQFGGGMKLDSAIVTARASTRHDPVKPNGLQKLHDKWIKKNMVPINTEPLRKDTEHLKEVTVQYLLNLFTPVFQQLLSFYTAFAGEIAFYKGAVRFINRMKELMIPLSFPEAKPMGTKDTSFTYLYELSMAVYLQSCPVGNNAEWKNNRLTLITGANQGGKSTFLRSYGIAQVLMQSGMPVPAQKFSAPVYRQIFTHFTRSEDEQLSSGRLREELQRMSNMVGAAVPDSLFLLNESFASTTEKEGSRIAEGILRAFYENQITTFMVTHLFYLARKLYQEQWEGSDFLVAEREEDGTRTYRIIPGEPSHTSYGTDLFYQALKEDTKSNTPLQSNGV